MKTIFFLLSFIPFISIELNAQPDTVVLKDSVPSVTVTMPDSFIFNPSIYYPSMTLGPWYTSSDPSMIYIPSIVFESPYTPKGARKDIKAGKPTILFSGGFGGMPDFNSKEDKLFQKKYKVTFYSQGCVRMPNDDEEGYNQVIFAYLDEKYGKDWRYELSEGVVGFEYPEKPIISQCKSTAELTSPLAMQLANPGKIGTESMNPETETSVWWYILPTSGFALLVSLYFIKKRKN